jgi:hypothetical protein
MSGSEDENRPATVPKAHFEFTVTDTVLIEGRGLILSPPFRVDEYHFGRSERVRVQTPDGRVFEADADVEIPRITPRPKVFQSLFIIRGAQKNDIPIGSKVWLLRKNAEEVRTQGDDPAILPGGCLLVIGVGIIGLGLFGIIFDDMNGGPNEKYALFWLILGGTAAVGVWLSIRGVRRLRKKRTGNEKS